MTIGESLTSRTHWFKLHVATVTRCPMVEVSCWPLAYLFLCGWSSCLGVQIERESSHKCKRLIYLYSGLLTRNSQLPTTFDHAARGWTAGLADKVNGTDNFAVAVFTDPGLFGSHQTQTRRVSQRSLGALLCRFYPSTLECTAGQVDVTLPNTASRERLFE